jgi:putative PIN family toxin of toxin-antitoxin system
VFDEYEAVAATLQPRFPKCNTAGILAWLRLKALWVEQSPLGKQRSRDPQDDPFLSCALAANAQFLVTGDRDLLVLNKPFGIQTVTPAQFLGWLHDTQKPG